MIPSSWVVDYGCLFLVVVLMSLISVYIVCLCICFVPASVDDIRYLSVIVYLIWCVHRTFCLFGLSCEVVLCWLSQVYYQYYQFQVVVKKVLTHREIEFWWCMCDVLLVSVARIEWVTSTFRRAFSKCTKIHSIWFGYTFDKHSLYPILPIFKNVPIFFDS